VVFTIANLDVATDFYRRVLDGAPLGRACRIGGAALNLHWQRDGAGRTVTRHGSGDLCLRWAGTADEARTSAARGAQAVGCPVARHGADGAHPGSL